MRNVIIVLVVFLTTFNQLSAQISFEQKDVEKLIVYAFPFQIKLRAGITSETIQEKASLKMEFRSPNDFYQSDLLQFMEEFFETHESTGANPTGDIRMQFLVFSEKGKMDIYVNSTGSLFHNNRKYKLSDKELAILLGPIPITYYPMHLR